MPVYRVRTIALAAGLMLAFALALLPAQAQSPVTIINPGFEDPAVNTFSHFITGWNITGGGAGVWNINSYPQGYWNVTAPEGNQIAYVSAAPLPGSPASISQVLTAVLEANTLYVLTGLVGHPIGFGTTPDPDTTFTAELLAGGNLLASASGTGPEGSFTGFQVSFNSAGSSFLGLPLAIRLSSSQPQTDFDDLRLDATLLPCPLAQGYWMNLSGAWPFASLRLGSQSYVQSELLAILGAEVGTGRTADVSLILADQLIAAKLSVANGSEATAFAGLISEADSLLSRFRGKLPYRISPSSAAGRLMVDYATVLYGVLAPPCKQGNPGSGTRP